MASGFLIEICDPLTGEIADQIRVADSMRMLLENDLDVDEISKGASYEIGGDLLDRIALSLGVEGVHGRPGRIRVQRWFDELPYRLHTGRELSMMLHGEKPLSVFGDDMPDIEDSGIVPTRIFEPYVASGVMVRRDRMYVLGGIKCRDVLYAMAEEAWRIDAYLLLVEIAERNGWSESLERMQGRLLGYTDEQNDAYFEALSSMRER